MSCRVRFDRGRLANELKSIAEVAKPLLTPLGQMALTSCIDSLGQVLGKKPMSWSIPKHRPIQTRASHGEYEKNRKQDGQPVYGEMSFVWDVIPVQKGNRPRSSPMLEVVGKASVRIALFEGDPLQGSLGSKPVADWNADVGLVGSGGSGGPGCHFHAQVPWETISGMNWGLSIPRLPSPFASPVDVLDMLLGELFQNGWPRLCKERRTVVQQWSAGQRERLQNVLRWQVDEMNKPTDVTAWLALKGAKPDVSFEW